MPDIMFVFDVAASPERVYGALTTAGGIRSWWTRDAELDAVPGGAGTFGFFERARITTIRIDALDAARTVAWTTVDSNVPGWTGTQIGFDLRPDGHDTTFRFSHRGFARHDDAYARTTWGWGTYFRSLELYLITGKGTPHGDR
jgi:uncharacterized protein YndB with AHSA1/START domain